MVSWNCTGSSKLMYLASPRSSARWPGNAHGPDTCSTRYFHLQACHRRRKNYLLAISHNGQTFTEEEAKADIVFSYYNEILGKPFQRLHRIDLQQLDLPRLDLSELIAPFSAEEVAAIVRETPADRAPGPDGFSGAFYTLQGGVGGGWTRCSAGVPIALGPRLSQLPPPQ